MADSMQNDAMERFRQMYSKAQPQSVTNNNRIESQKLPKTEETITEGKTLIHNKKEENNLDLFMRDKEKSLILLLIVILMSEKADTTLILALMYLVI